MDQLSTQPALDGSPWILDIVSCLNNNMRLQSFPLLSKDWNRLTQGDYFKEFLCNRLSSEHGVFCPSKLPPGLNWSSMFLELFPLHHMWQPSQQHLLYRKHFEQRAALQRFTQFTDVVEGAVVDEPAVPVDPTTTSATTSATTSTTTSTPTPTPPASRYTIGVCVRFRPARETPQGQSKQELQEARHQAAKNARFLLPLHQRIQIIKIRDHCTTKLALHTLQKEGAWFDRSWKKKPMHSNGEDKENEATYGSGSQEARVQSVDAGTGTVIMVAPSIGMRPFQFDHVLEGPVSQSTTYSLTTQRLVLDM